MKNTRNNANEKRSCPVSFRITKSARTQLERFAKVRQCSMSDAIDVALTMLVRYTASDLIRESLRVEANELEEKLTSIRKKLESTSRCSDSGQKADGGFATRDIRKASRSQAGKPNIERAAQ